nr:uncharacterized protein CFP56_72581 [Quercus suber]
MAGLEDLWNKFTLTEDEEGGADVPNQEAVEVHRLAGKFFTKRVLNVEAVARTFKPLWRPVGELKIRDSWDNVLVFEFEDVMDLERVLEYEPWSYDKSLIAFQRVFDVEQIPHLVYNQVTFWVQLHNIPLKNLSHESSEAIARAIGTVIQVADPEDDDAGGEFLRARIVMDITKPLPRVSKLKSGGKQIGLVGLKYERLLNFYYWCGRVTHGERECEVWLRGRGKLSRDDQQYGEWLRAEPVRQSKKTVAVISGRKSNQPPWWRKSQPGQGNESSTPRQGEENYGSHSAMEAEHYVDNFGTVGVGPKQVVGDQGDAHSSAFTGEQVLEQRKSAQVETLDEQVVGLSLQGQHPPPCKDRPYDAPRQSQVHSRPSPNTIPLQDCTNTATKSNSNASVRTWKKLAREPDHKPILLSPDSEVNRFYKKGRSFRFEAMWLRDRSCEEVIRDSWGGEMTQPTAWGFNSKVLACQSNLRDWNKKTFGHVRNSLKQKLAELKTEEESGGYRSNPLRIQLDSVLLFEIGEVIQP